MSSIQGSVPLKVFLSPFVLSTVMLDNSNCPGDQEGFLIGRSYKSVRFEINDQSMCNAEEDLMISVFSAYPCGTFFSFYDNKGVINVEFIKNFLGDRIKQIAGTSQDLHDRNPNSETNPLQAPDQYSVVGWYRYRRNVPPYPSAREALIHRNLVKAFSGNLSIGDNYFVYGVFGSSTSDSFATHTYDYAFYIERPDRFVPLVISMLNLIDTKTKYRNGSLASSFVSSQTFDSVLNISWNFESCWQTEDGIQQMHKLLRDKCSNLAEELTASESVNATLEDDIKALEEELATLTAADIPLEEDQSEDEIVDQDNAENIPPKEANTKHFRKRYWSEVVDFETEKKHPVYGKYFEQNRAEEQDCVSQGSSEASDNNYYTVPPQKKFKVLQEHKRVLDHDYSSASDEDSHKYTHDPEDDKADDLDGISLPSETEDFGTTDGAVSQEVEVYSENTSRTEESVTQQPSTVEDQPGDKEKVEVIQIEEDNACQTKSPNIKDDPEDLKKGEGNQSSLCGKPFIIYCKPAFKEDESPNSDK